VPALDLLFRFVVAERIGTIIVSLLVAHTAWHWTTERAERLSQFPWPTLDAAFVASSMRWLMLILVLGCAIWLVNATLRRSGWLAAEGKAPVRNADD
jgi:hypothetical protein